jgi:hypothetical protein
MYGKANKGSEVLNNNARSGSCIWYGGLVIIKKVK